MIGRGKAQKYFQIDPDTGVIQVRDDLRKETTTEYEVKFIIVNDRNKKHLDRKSVKVKLQK